MILKIYLTISILSYIMAQLSVLRCVQEYKKKYGVKEKRGTGLINNIRQIMACFIPFINIIILIFFTYIFLFADERYLEKDIFSKINKSNS